MGFRSKDPISRRRAVSGGRRSVLRLLGAMPWFLTACGREPVRPGLAAGAIMAGFGLPDLGGQMIEVVPGRQPMLINFWATWCLPCRAEMGSLDRLHAELGGAGLAVYGVSVDEDINLVREFVLQNRVEIPILHDRSGTITQNRLGVRAFPTTVLVRRSAVVADVVVGARAWDEPPMLAAARTLL